MHGLYIAIHASKLACMYEQMMSGGMFASDFKCSCDISLENRMTILKTKGKKKLTDGAEESMTRRKQD